MTIQFGAVGIVSSESNFDAELLGLVVYTHFYNIVKTSWFK